MASIFLIKPSYTATTRVYVVGQKSTENITAQDLQAGSYLANDYKEIITSNEVLSNAVKKVHSSIDIAKLSKMVSVAIPADTRVISISVTSHDPREASELANSIRDVASDKIKEVTKVQDITILETAHAPSSPSSPNIKRNALLGMIAGGAVAIVSVLFSEILDDRVKRPEDVEEVLGLTLLGVVPNTKKM